MSQFDLILDVFPEGTSPFRTVTREWLGEFHRPGPGDSLRVRCNPEKKAVELDLSEDARFNPKIYRPAYDAAQKQEHDRILSEALGTPAASGSDLIDDPQLAELARLEAAERAPDENN